MERVRSRVGLSLRSVALLLLTAASYSALMLLARNPASFPHLWRTLVFVAGAWFLAILYAMLALVVGATRWASAAGGMIMAGGLTLGGGVADRFGTWLTVLALAGLASGVAVLVMHLHEIRRVRYVVVGLGLFLVAGPLGLAADTWLNWGDPVDIQVADTLSLEMEERPDIYLVVLDGFMGVQGFEAAFGVEGPQWAPVLADRGFQVPTAWASYPMTILSVPSLLQTDYLVRSDTEVTRRLRVELSRTIGSENQVAAALRANGYETVMVESGWAWSNCGDAYEVCIPSHFLDETTYHLVDRSILRASVTEPRGSFYTVGAQHTMDWLMGQGLSWASGERPLFIFAHIMAPHPPLFLGSDCQVIDSSRDLYGGFGFYRESASERTRLKGYIDQIACIEQFMLEFTTAADEDDVIVFVGDHGTDSRQQLSTPPKAWSGSETVERLSTIVAVRGVECPISDPIVLPDVMRSILSCFIDGDSGAIRSPRMFIGSEWAAINDPGIVEVPSPFVQQILEGDGNLSAAAQTQIPLYLNPYGSTR